MSFINQTESKVKTLKGVQVLVVDNDRDSLYLYETLLKSCGANVITAASVKEAIDVLSWLLPNILICETRFRGESLSTLTTELNALETHGGNHIPTIAITTWITDSLAQIIEAGFEHYLLKPVDLGHLVSLIRDLVVSNKRRRPPYGLALRIHPRNKRKMIAVSGLELDRQTVTNVATTSSICPKDSSLLAQGLLESVSHQSTPRAQNPTPTL
ncbi:hypothetical protein C7B82_04030 [Stenomitos frigidus ULC18]|uniref:Response regulatory domain-containing protein n=1 Tax=Stenomitos frigidus ULC18 TaxID=2107698 RepID=A0A2T1ELS4_9CYAN|nr:hypothetical protein C7B82_04030 [Stenomitos frigidus ULC18]